MNKILRLFVSVVFTVALLEGAAAGGAVRYLAFQIFTGTPGSNGMLGSTSSTIDLYNKVIDIKQRINIIDTGNRHIGFVLGPIAFDNSDNEVRGLIGSGFDIALATGVAVGFHIDDSMFWGRMTGMNTPSNIEWLDWNGTPNTGRLLSWSSQPVKIAPQLCINSKGVKDAVTKRSGLIGSEIVKGLQKLHNAGKDDLFVGVIGGWETYIGRDYDTGKYLGYCAMTNAGFSALNPPADIDEERAKITAHFVEFWASSLVQSGVPIGKVYSHTTFMPERTYNLAKRLNSQGVLGSYLENSNFSRPSTAFCSSCVAGLSTYPQQSLMEAWYDELNKRGNPPWASCEGTAINIQNGGMQIGDMETYLGNMFNRGAVLVNIYGWGVGDQSFPFRMATENNSAIAAYQKFMSGGSLRENP